MVALLFIMQNAGTNYLATVAFASVNRGIEGSSKCNGQKAAAALHHVPQGSTVRTSAIKDHARRGKCYRAFEPDFQDPCSFVLDISVIIVITLRKSPMVFLFFLVVVPFAVLTMRAFKKPVREKTRNFEARWKTRRVQLPKCLK